MSDEERDIQLVRAEETSEFVAARPRAEEIYRELMARKKAGNSEKGDATRLRAAREILRRSGGMPKLTE